MEHHAFDEAFFIMPQLESDFSDHTYSIHGGFGLDIVMSVASIHNGSFFFFKVLGGEEVINIYE